MVAHQRIRFSTDDVPKAQRLDLWYDTIEAFFDTEISKSVMETNEFGAHMTLVHLDELLFGRVAATQQYFSRNRARIAADGLDHFFVQVFLKGGGPIVDGVPVGPGDLIFIDMGQDHARDSTSFEHLSFIIPRDKDPDLSRVLEKLHNKRIPATHTLASIISRQMQQLWSYQSDLTLGEAKLVVDSTVFMIAGLVKEGAIVTDDRSFPSAAALGHAIRSYIDQNLSAPLSVEAIIHEFNVSRSLLYRLFEREGGVMRYIMERRLQRAYQHLTRQDATHPNIMSVAARVGFTSDSHFSHAVKKRFGLSPSDLRHKRETTLHDARFERALIDLWLRDLRSSKS